MDDKPKVTEMHRLSAESYAQLERATPSAIGVNDETSPISVAYMLGVQAVLKKLREGWVVG